ncbi:MAG: DUF58 domain-containing protein [Chitinivibrionales bacterium]|nr:DUF58 domain-containing protein [Chitinivibrionales bacterium]
MIPKEVLEKVRRIEIKTKSIVNDILSGEYQSAFKGRGMEFSEVRTYIQGDDIRTIDWNVTARAGELYVKKYVEERELTVFLVVDASASGNFGSIRQMKAEIGVELCALLAFSAIKNNDRVGLIIFTSEVEKFIPPKKGKNHVLRVIRELLYFEPTKKGTNIEEAITFLNRVQRKKSVVFFVSDFFDREIKKPLSVAARRHDMIAVSLTDPRERTLPDVGLIELHDPETGVTIIVDSSDKKLREGFQMAGEKRRQALLTTLRSCGVDHIEISTSQDYVEPLVRFFKRRERALV